MIVYGAFVARVELATYVVDTSYISPMTSPVNVPQRERVAAVARGAVPVVLVVVPRVAGHPREVARDAAVAVRFVHDQPIDHPAGDRQFELRRGRRWC